MPELDKVGPAHLQRQAVIYIRQSSPSQVENNQESRQRQYALVSRATELGWAPDQVLVIDDDLGLTGSGLVDRSGFAR